MSVIDLGKKLKMHREHLGLTLEQVKIKSHNILHVAELCDIENGERIKPNVKTLETLAKIYGLDVYALVSTAPLSPVPTYQP